MSSRTNATQTAADFLDRNAEQIALLNDSIFYFGELGMQEHETARLMSDLLEDAGFTTERGISGFPTAFCAQHRTGEGPIVALHAEYDSTPHSSQQPGVADQAYIVPGAPGHCEGHNVNGAVLVSAALATKHAMDRCGIGGTLKVFGAPAEEQVVSRPYFVRDGWFDDVDVCMTPHIGGGFRVGYGLIQSGLVSAVFTFTGESAHAGVMPWKGRDALDAVVLMDAGMAQYREHLVPGVRCQRVITKGGDQPNVIPAEAAIWWYFRGESMGAVDGLFERAKAIAEGAAMMTGTHCSVEVLSAAWPVRGNRIVAETVERNYLDFGQPEWSAEEHKLALEVQARAGVAEVGLDSPPVRIAGPAKQRPSANDAGDISWRVPHAKLFFPGNIPGLANHHWTAGVALATSIAHKGAISGAKVLAGASLDFLASPDHTAEARRVFEEEIKGQSFHSILPPDQSPPLELNRSTMEKYRPLMARHYLSQRPVFILD